MTSDRTSGLMVLCRVQTRLCCVPIEHVVETMRPLPIEPIAGAPQFISGLSIIRGTPVLVVNTAHLLGGTTDWFPGRFVTIRVANRGVALAVDEVVAVREIPLDSLTEMPPLLGHSSQGVVSFIGVSDAQLLLVLQSIKQIVEPLWHSLEAGGVS